MVAVEPVLGVKVDQPPVIGVVAVQGYEAEYAHHSIRYPTMLSPEVIVGAFHVTVSLFPTLIALSAVTDSPAALAVGVMTTTPGAKAADPAKGMTSNQTGTLLV